VRRTLFVALAAMIPSLVWSQVRAELIPEHTVVQPGQRTRVAIVLRHAPGWHTYWRRGGDAGLPTSVRWTADPAIRIDTLQWPAPSRFVDLGIITFGYDIDVPLIAEVLVDKATPTGRAINLGGRVDWLACQTQCVPGGARVDHAMRTGARAVSNPAFVAAVRSRGVQWPRPTAAVVSAQLGDTALQVTVRGAPNARCRFYPETRGIPAEISSAIFTRERTSAITPVASNRRATLPDTMRGVLRCEGTEPAASYHRVPLGTR
jgi:DsbC/DsbD-like thiol-disulfide interchange protein